jgi:hypothetical protein
MRISSNFPPSTIITDNVPEALARTCAVSGLQPPAKKAAIEPQIFF